MLAGEQATQSLKQAHGRGLIPGPHFMRAGPRCRHVHATHQGGGAVDDCDVVLSIYLPEVEDSLLHVLRTCVCVGGVQEDH